MVDAAHNQIRHRGQEFVDRDLDAVSRRSTHRVGGLHLKPRVTKWPSACAHGSAHGDRVTNRRLFVHWGNNMYIPNCGHRPGQALNTSCVNSVVVADKN